MSLPIRLATLSLVLAVGMGAAAEDWTRFRGDNGSGISRQTNIPVEWTDDAIAWKTDLPGTGHSSPCVWKKHLFVTTATDKGRKRLLLCLNADSGKERWRKELTLTSNPKHQKSSWASGTPTTDGNHVYVVFADQKSYIVSAWDFSGQEVWQRDLGSFLARHGQGVSPIVVDDMVIVPNDQRGASSIVALDKETGEPRWKTPRDSGATSYSTPLVVNHQGKSALICVSEASGVTCLDTSNGKTLWATAAMPHRTVASPVITGDIVLAICGKGGQGLYLAAVNFSTSDENKRIVFERQRKLPYVPTPVVWENRAILWGDRGIVTCLEMPSGLEIWTRRVGGNYTASPICINGHVYCITEEGVVTVIQAGREFKLLGKTNLGDGTHATPAVANEHLYIRTFHHLFAIKSN